MSIPRAPELALYERAFVSGCAALFSMSATGSAYAVFTGTWWLAIVFGACAVWWVHAVMRRFAEFRTHAHLPGPRPSFFLGNLPQLLAFGHGGRHTALEVLHRDFGPVVRIHLAWGSPPYVSLAYASANLQKPQLDSQRRADRTVLPRSLMGMPLGRKHKAHRQAMAPHLTTRSVKDRADVLQRLAMRYVERWAQRESVEPQRLQDDVRSWSAHCLGAFLFGDAWNVEEDLRGYLDALNAIEEEVSFRAFHPFFVRWIFRRRRMKVQAAYRCLFSFLEEAKLRKQTAAAACPHGARPGDLLHALTARSSTRGPGRWTHHECVEEMMSLVLGGTDSMSFVVSQALFLLSRNPEVQAAARRAITPHGRDDSFVRNVVHETMRLYPAVPFSAKISRDRVVERGMPIPAGTTLMWAKNVVGKDAAAFTDPESFRPERFARRDDSVVSAFLPFGAGPRHCIGHRLAEEQCATLLAAVLRHFRIEPVDGLHVEFHATVSVAPSAVPVRLTPISGTLR